MQTNIYIIIYKSKDTSKNQEARAKSQDLY